MIIPYVALDAGISTSHLLPPSPNLHSSVVKMWLNTVFFGFVDSQLCPRASDTKLSCPHHNALWFRILLESKNNVWSCGLSSTEHDHFGCTGDLNGTNGRHDDNRTREQE